VLFKLVEIADLTDYQAGLWDVPASLEGNGDSFNINAGMLFKGKDVNLGISFRSGFNIKYSGDLTLTTSVLPPPFNALFPTTAKGETTFKFPGILSFGFSINVTKKFLLSADANYVLWSRFDNYIVTFDDPMLADLETAENFKDAWTFRGGLQYKATEKLALRGGFLYDLTPQPADTMDPLLPDANRFAFTVGFGYTMGKFVLDVTYHHEVFSDRKAPNRYIYQFAQINLGEGTYKTTADLLGISLSFVF
jgi:long-chain fatty acid transport protein